MAGVVNLDDGLVLGGIDARAVPEFLLEMVQEQGHAVSGGLRDELATRENDQAGIPGGAQHPHRGGHNGLEGGLQLRALYVQRAGQDVEGPYVEVADFSQVFLVAGGHCFCSSR